MSIRAGLCVGEGGAGTDGDEKRVPVATAACGEGMACRTSRGMDGDYSAAVPLASYLVLTPCLLTPHPTE